MVPRESQELGFNKGYRQTAASVDSELSSQTDMGFQTCPKLEIKARPLYPQATSHR
jgi:hypothetical protein